MPEQEKTDISILSVGAGLGHTEIWGTQSLTVNTAYINLAPYEALLPSEQDVVWRRPFESLSGEAVYRNIKNKGIFKMYTGFNHSRLALDQLDVNTQGLRPFALTNDNFYINTTYKHFLDHGLTLYTGGSLSLDSNTIAAGTTALRPKEIAGHLKARVKKTFNERVKLNAGLEYFRTDFSEPVRVGSTDFNSGYLDHLTAAFVEGDVFFSKKWA